MKILIINDSGNQIGGADNIDLFVVQSGYMLRKIREMLDINNIAQVSGGIRLYEHGPLKNMNQLLFVERLGVCPTFNC